MTQTAGAAACTREWLPAYPLELRSALGPLRRGPGDPATRVEPDGTVWWASTTADGPATLALRSGSDGQVEATGWGPGAGRVLDGLPELLGSADDDSGFVAHHPLIATARSRNPWLRLGRTGRVWDVLVAAVLEQKVTGREAWRSWRELCLRFGTVAPGPAPAGMRVPPDAGQLRAIADWQWHRAGVDGARRRTLLAVAAVAGRLERAVELGGEPGRDLLTVVPGIGRWTAAEVAQRAWGDPDAVSVGDFHLHDIVGWALAGRAASDAEMLELLAPYAPQRHRAVCYLLASGFRKPRFGPRMPIRDYRSV